MGACVRNAHKSKPFNFWVEKWSAMSLSGEEKKSYKCVRKKNKMKKKREKNEKNLVFFSTQQTKSFAFKCVFVCEIYSLCHFIAFFPPRNAQTVYCSWAKLLFERIVAFMIHWACMFVLAQQKKKKKKRRRKNKARRGWMIAIHYFSVFFFW